MLVISVCGCVAGDTLSMCEVLSHYYHSTGAPV